MAKASPLRPAHTSKYMKRPDQIRPPKPAGRRCTAWRNWLSIENLTLLLAAFALAFVSTSFRCPQTGMNVQHWLADAPPDAKDSHSSVACPACAKTHFIHNSTDRLLGDRVS